MQQIVSLKTAVDDAVHTLQGSAKLKSVALSSSVSAELEAYADPVRLLQTLIILCDNAIKFTPAGGSVGIEAHRFALDPDFLVVEVSDNGCGIAPEMTERIFEHLYQISDVSDAGRNGLGLGLHIARGAGHAAGRQDLGGACRCGRKPFLLLRCRCFARTMRCLVAQLPTSRKTFPSR